METQYFIAYQLARLFKRIEPSYALRRLDELQLWNCFSYYPSVHRWDILDGQAGKYIGKDKKWHAGKYLFTGFAHPKVICLNDIQRYRTNISAPAICLDDGASCYSLTIDVYGTYLLFTVKDDIPMESRIE